MGVGRFAGLIVSEARDLPACGFEQRLTRSRIPLGSRAEARIQIGVTLCQQAELQRAAHRGENVGPYLLQILQGLNAGMRAAAHHA